VIDASGHQVSMDAAPQRIVSCSPAISEIVCSLGLGDKLVAVTDYDDYPQRAKDLKEQHATVGGFYTPSFEAIVSYNPDLVLMNTGVDKHRSVAEQLRTAGFTVVELPAQEDLEGAYATIEMVGTIAGKADRAKEITSEMAARIADIGAKVSDKERPTALYVSYAESGFTYVWPSGADTAVDEIITLAGGENVFADQSGWFNPSTEVLLMRASQIDYIIITSMYSGGDAENMTRFFRSDTTWKESPAVKDNHIYYLQGQAENIFNRQSVRMVDAVQLLAQMFHPDVFGSTLPNETSGVNIIGDEYEQYLVPGTSNPSSTSAVAVRWND
jgi:iron complex transport system substrate-binding protein